MKMKFMCSEAGRRIASKQGGMGKVSDMLMEYYATFGSIVEDLKKPMGKLTITSQEPMHYKPMKKYTINLNEDSGIIDLSEMRAESKGQG